MAQRRIYVVFEEVSDQYGTSKAVKAFSEKEDAEKFQSTLKNRSYSKEMVFEVSQKSNS